MFGHFAKSKPTMEHALRKVLNLEPKKSPQLNSVLEFFPVNFKNFKST